MNNISGIYLITNTVSKKRYVGSACSLRKRRNDHYSQLRGNRHINKHLQSAWNAYGADVFVFEIIARCPKEYLLKLEQFFIDTINPEYNICKRAGSTMGKKHTAHSKLKMSISKKGTTISEDTRKKLSAISSMRRHSDETKRKMSIIGKRRTIDRAEGREFRKPKFKKVYQYDSSGKFIKSHISIIGAAKELGLSRSHISSASNCKRPSCGGFQFRSFYSESIAPLSSVRKRLTDNKIPNT